MSKNFLQNSANNRLSGGLWRLRIGNSTEIPDSCRQAQALSSYCAKQVIERNTGTKKRNNRRLQPSNWSPLWESRISLDNGTIACSLCRLSQLDLHSPRPALAVNSAPAFPHIALTIFSVTFLASPGNIVVLSRQNRGLSLPPKPAARQRSS